MPTAHVTNTSEPGAYWPGMPRLKRKPSANAYATRKRRNSYTGPSASTALLLAGAWKPDIEVARAEVAQAEAEVAQIRTEIDRAVVRAPIDGQVLQVNVRVGERVGDQAQQGLMVIGRVPPIHVRAISTSTISPSFTTTRRPCFNCEAKTIATIRSDSCGLNLTWSARSGSPATTPSESTPALQVIYALDEIDAPVYVGEQVDVFIDAVGPGGVVASVVPD